MEVSKEMDYPEHQTQRGVQGFMKDLESLVKNITGSIDHGRNLRV